MSDLDKRIAALSPEQREKLLAKLAAQAPVQAAGPVIAPRAGTGPARLSFAQQRLWLLHQMDSAQSSYNIPIGMRVKGSLDLAALESSLTALVQRHEVLRTRYAVVDGEPRQFIEPAATFELRQSDLTRLSGDAQDAEARRMAAEVAGEPFDLGSTPLLRAAVLRLSERESILLLVVHHTACDGWSLGILLQEMFELYSSSREGRAARLRPLPIQYADFAEWQRERLQGDLLRSEVELWRRWLEGAPMLQMTTDRQRPAARSSAGAMQTRTLSGDVVERLDALVRRERVTQTIVVLAAFQMLLARYTGQQDIVVGSAIANRTAADVEPLIGCFVNMLPMRTDVSGDPSFEELIARVREMSIRVYDHQDLPFEKIVEELQPQRDPGQNPFFQVAMSAHTPFADVSTGDLTLEAFETPMLASRFDLELHVVNLPGALRLDMCYATDLFDQSTIAGILESFETLLRAGLADPSASIASAPLVDETKRRQILEGWNDTASDYPASSISSCVEYQAAEHPQSPALVWGETVLSYGELNDTANKIARYLRDCGVTRGSRVALCLERGPDMITGMLGALKAGAAYVPLDPEYPLQRLSLMLADSRPAVLLTDRRLAASLPADVTQIVYLDEQRSAIAAQSGRNLDVSLSGDDLAYVIYTSGSTGMPKGVCVTHRAVVRLVWNANFAPLQSTDIIAQASNSSFDAATFEIWGAFVNGARLVGIPKEALLVPATLFDELRRHDVSTLFLTTALFNQVARDRPDAFARIRHLMFGGEAVDPGAVRRVLEAGAPERLLHVYGPTENTTFSTWFETTSVSPAATTVPIGRGISNSTVYILDERFQPVAPGVPGEIFVGGDGLAIGYLDRSAMTAEKFVPSPFADGQRLYRTGDLGRWTADGYVEFVGRTDDQVKIRGFRIEPSEIAVVLCQHPLVSTGCVVLDGEGLHRRLVAYVVFTDAEAAGDWQDLRAFLRERLPEYMMPAAFVAIDHLPLTPNGKVDRSALPAPEEEWQEGAAYLPPRTVFEERVAAIWRSALSKPAVGVHDNFFDLGGHSLLLVSVHAQLEREFVRKIPIVALFQYPTVESIAAYLASDAAETAGPIAEKRTGQPARSVSNAIAVVGIAGRFPGAADVEAFWSNLRDGVESIRFFSDKELRESGVSEALLNDSRYVRARAALDDVDKFDAAFFGYTPREAELMDPQHRLFLECAWHALENAGCDPFRYPGRIGVYAGAKANSYFLNLLSDPRALEAAGALQGVIASQADFLATKVSYKLNLRGPSVNVQSACSTSLVAVHQAARSLLTGECDMALAGGVTVAVPGKTGYLYQEDGIGSPDGHCRAFDAQARGTVGGDGVGVVVLKRLDVAVRDGDVIHAVILGSAINNDGSNKVGYTAPSVEGQAEVIRLAHESAAVEPETISYVEAHGTGTALGDPIEISALALAFGDARPNRVPCAVGSLKTNVGHLDAAAGVAGLIKTVLALEHREIPPSLHFERPNPAIDFAATPFVVNGRLQPWTSADESPRRAGVSSFGIGGTNAHVVVEEAPIRPSSGPSRTWKILTLSARTESALEAATAELRAQLKRDPSIDLADAAYTLQTGRARFDRRRAVVCKATTDALHAIDGLRAGHRFTSAVRGRPSVAFLFPGQGSQFQGMGRELYDQEPVFRKTFDECADQFAALLGVDLRAALHEKSDTDSGGNSLAPTSATQAALFAVELSLARLWMSLGVTPAACLGHSIGEYVAACVSGVLSTADAIALIAARGIFMDRAPQGAMLALSVTEDKARELLDEGLWLAVINAPSQCVVAGTVDAIAVLEHRLEREGIPAQRLQTAGAFHSGLMDGVEHALADTSRAVRINPPRIPYLSNLTGDWITPADLADRGYWAKHTRGAVRFSENVRRLIDSGATVFLEVGPGRVLSSLVRRQLASTAQSMLIPSPIQHPGEIGSEAERFAGALGQAWTSGVELDWSEYYAHERRLRVELPQYPFARERYWIERKRPAAASATSLSKSANVSEWLYAPVWKQVPAAPSRVSYSRESPARWGVIGDGGPTGVRIAAALERSGAEVVNLDADAGLSDGVPQHIVLAQEDGVRGLTDLVKTLARANVTQEIDIRVLCCAGFGVTGEEECAPEQAALAGLCRVVPQEHPNLRCTLIDLGTSQAPESSIERVVEILRREPAAALLAIRGSRQWALSFEPIGRGAQQPLVPALKAGGVYLITGGLGRIGAALAEHLVDTVDAAVVLVSRSESVPERLRRLVNGGRAMVAQGDVADERRMKQIVAEAEKAFGPLAGVFHAAGFTSGAGFAPIVDLEAPEFEEQFRSKAEGARVLSRVLGTRPLDFVALFSSISTVLGGLGFGAYAAANAFMDSFADQQTRRGTAPWISIGWDGWRFDESQGTDRGSGPGAFALTPAEGMAALDRALSFSANPVVIVSTADLQNRLSMLAGPAPKQTAGPSVDAPTESHARPDLGSTYVEARNDRERAIANIWQELLGIAPVGIHDNFFELGGHSLLAVQLVFRLTRELQIDLSAHHVFDAPTVAELASLVDDLVEQRTRQAADIASVLDEVAGLSDEEVERLLAGE